MSRAPAPPERFWWRSTSSTLTAKGEESIVEHYDAAVAEADAPTVVMLKRQKSELLDKVEAMRPLEA